MKCPGQDTQYWTGQAIFEAPCPQCGTGVEFFKDDTSRKCGACGHRFINPRMDFGCASYCNFAEQCLGDLPPELVAQKEDLLKDRVAVAVKRHLKNDFKRIGRAVRRARYAEQFGKAAGINLSVALMAAYLWELDIASGQETGIDTPRDVPVARTILEELMAPQPLINSVCNLLTADRHNESVSAEGELKVVLEAEARVAMEEEETAAQPLNV